MPKTVTVISGPYAGGTYRVFRDGFDYFLIFNTRGQIVTIKKTDVQGYEPVVEEIIEEPEEEIVEIPTIEEQEAEEAAAQEPTVPETPTEEAPTVTEEPTTTEEVTEPTQEPEAS